MLESIVSVLVRNKEAGTFLTLADAATMPSKVLPRTKTTKQLVNSFVGLLLCELGVQSNSRRRLICVWRHNFRNGCGFDELDLSHYCVLVDEVTTCTDLRYKWKKAEEIDSYGEGELGNEMMQALQFIKSSEFCEEKVRLMVSGPSSYAAQKTLSASGDTACVEEPYKPQESVESGLAEVRLRRPEEEDLHRRFLQISWPSFTVDSEQFQRLFNWQELGIVPLELGNACDCGKQFFSAIAYVRHPNNDLKLSSPSKNYLRHLTFSDVLYALTVCRSNAGSMSRHRALVTFAFYANETDAAMDSRALTAFVRHSTLQESKRALQPIAADDRTIKLKVKILIKTLFPQQQRWTDADFDRIRINPTTFIEARRERSFGLPDFRILAGDAVSKHIEADWLPYHVSPLILEESPEAASSSGRKCQINMALVISKNLISDMRLLLKSVRNPTPETQHQEDSQLGSSITNFTQQSTNSTARNSHNPPDLGHQAENAGNDFRVLPILPEKVLLWVTKSAYLRNPQFSPDALPTLIVDLQRLQLEPPAQQNRTVDVPPSVNYNPSNEDQSRGCITRICADPMDSDRVHPESEIKSIDVRNETMSLCAVDKPSLSIVGVDSNKVVSAPGHPPSSNFADDPLRISREDRAADLEHQSANEVELNQPHLPDISDTVSLFLCNFNKKEQKIAMCKYERGWYMPYRHLPSTRTVEQSVKDTAQSLVQELLGDQQSKAGIKVHGVMHVWHRFMPIDPVDSVDKAHYCSLKHYCVLVTCDFDKSLIEPTEPAEPLDRTQPVVEWMTAERIKSLFTTKQLLGDEPQQLVVCWNDSSYNEFREKNGEHRLPCTGYSFATPATFISNPLENHDLAYLSDRVITEMQVTRADETALYHQFVRKTWPSLSMNFKTFQQFVDLKKVLPVRIARSPVNPLPQEQNEQEMLRFYKTLCLNKPFYLHFHLLLLGFAVLQVGEGRNGAMSAGERRARYTFYYYDENGDGLLNFQEFLDLLLDDAAHRHIPVTIPLHRLALDAFKRISANPFLPLEEARRMQVDMETFLRSRKTLLSDYRIRMKCSISEILQGFPAESRRDKCNPRERYHVISEKSVLDEKERLAKIEDMMFELHCALGTLHHPTVKEATAFNIAYTDALTLFAAEIVSASLKLLNQLNQATSVEVSHD